MPSTFADRLQRLRRERFVGREAEAAHFARMLAGGAPPVWLLHGPGGIGKSTLLQHLSQQAEGQGRLVLPLDARQLAATPAGWRQGLRAALQLAEGEALPAGLVLLVDGFEAIAALELWLRDEELPRFPADAVVLLAGRGLPDPRWQLDPGWQGLAAVTRLEPFSAEEALAFWQARLPGAAADDAALAQAQGHPLLLALLAEARRRGATGPGTGLDRGELLLGVLQRLAGLALTDAAERRAFDLLLVARSVNEALLADCVDAARAPTLWQTLAALPFVEQDERGLRVHDLVRERFAAAWLGRDAAAAASTHALREAVLHHLARHVGLLHGDGATQYLQDWFFVLGQTDSAPHIDHRHFETHYHDGLRRTEDAAAVRALVAARFGPTVQAIAAHWLAHAPGGWLLTRRRDGSVAGAALLLELEALDEALLAADPPALALKCWVRAQRRPCGSVLLVRLNLDAAGDGLPNPTVTLGGLRMNVRTLLEPAAEWNLLVHHNRSEMAALYASFTRFNWHREAPELAFEQDGRGFGVFVRDLVAEPVPEDWRPARPVLGPGRLDEAAFRTALHEAWRQVQRDDLLATNPLLAGTATLDSPARLRGALQAAVQALAAHPRDLKFHHALRLTWLDPGATQERVAEELGLPFNTYRYHLARGEERVAQALWQAEQLARRA
jgi:AAA ATPase domain